MRANVLVAALVPVVVAASVVDDVCSSSIYTKYATLTAASSQISSYCSSKFPVTPVSITTTTTTTVTVTDNATETDIETDTITETDTETDTTTVSTTTTETDTATETQTTTVDYTPLERRTAQPKCRRYTTTVDATTTPYVTTSPTSTPTGYDFFSDLNTEAQSVISTFCSCLEVPVTTTDIITSTVTDTTTVTGIITITDSITTTTTTTTTETDTETDTATTTTTTTTTATATCPASLPSACPLGLCVDTSSDINNCGSCGNQCADGEYCFDGVCKGPNQCNYQGSLFYCYPGSECVCYQTTEGVGFCGDSDGACGQTCDDSSDCPGSNVCLTAVTVGCTDVNTCSTDDDLATCKNTNSPKRLFRPRSEGVRKKPGDDQ